MGQAPAQAAPRRWLRLDPRITLLVLLLVNVVVFASPSLTTEWVCLAAIGLLLVCTGAWRQAISGALFYLGVMGLMLLCGVLPGPLAAFISMLVICIRKIMPTVYLASGLIATTRVSELICALQRLRLPQSIIITLAVTLRFFPTVKEEFDCIRDAMRLRGIGLTAKNILTRPLAVLECVFVPMIMRCAQIADELSAAAVVRGIDSTGKRSSLLQIALHPADALVATIFIALSLLAVLSGLGISINFVEAYGAATALLPTTQPTALPAAP